MSTKQHIFKSKWADVEVPQVVLTRFIGEVLEDADHGHGNKVAFLDASNPDRKITYKQFKKLAYQVCGPLKGETSGTLVAPEIPSVFASRWSRPS